MKKIKKFVKNNSKIIIGCIVIMAIFSCFMCTSGNVYALTNKVYYQGGSDFENFMGQALGKVLNMGLGVLGQPLAMLVNGVNIIMFLVLYTIFVSSGIANGFTFPFPDQIVFNGLSMLDPNFINPVNDSGAIINIMKDVIQNIYYSFYALAGTVFVLATVIIGIKLAFTSLASEKAQYKTAIKHWLIGIVLLFTIHFALAGMFAINEKICLEASKFCSDVSIRVNAFEFVPVVGQKIQNVINIVGGIFGQNDADNFADIDIKGYGGLVLKFVAKGLLQNDLIYSIGLAIMLGQTFSLVIQYVKRVFYSVILGMIAPLVIAVDTIQKVVTGKDTGVLKNWFQNIVAIIFNQSFQAIFLCISLLIIGIIDKQNHDNSTVNMDMIESVIAIVALHSIMKFDKLFKELLGIKDSKIMGGLNENAMRSFAAIKSGLSLAKRSTEPFQKRTQAKLRHNEASKQAQKIREKLANLGSGNDSDPLASNSGSNTAPAPILNNGNNGPVQTRETINEANDLRTSLIELRRALEENTHATQNSSNNSNGMSISDKREKLEEELAKAEAEEAKSRADVRAESLRAFTRFGTTVGSLGFGVGATGNLGDAVTVGNIVDVPMDKFTDRVVDKGVYGTAASKIENRKDDLVNKYISAGYSQADSVKMAEKSIANMQSQLNSAIPEALGGMIADITKETVKGVADVANKQGRKYAKTASKKIYKSSNIEDI